MHWNRIAKAMAELSIDNRYNKILLSNTLSKTLLNRAGSRINVIDMRDVFYWILRYIKTNPILNKDWPYGNKFMRKLNSDKELYDYLYVLLTKMPILDEAFTSFDTICLAGAVVIIDEYFKSRNAELKEFFIQDLKKANLL